VPGTARIFIDTTTNTVTAQPLQGDPTNRAIFAGGAIDFSSSTITLDEGNPGRRILSLNYVNTSGETIGAAGGIRLSFSNFKNLSGPSDLREYTQVADFAGSGAVGRVDGPVQNASFDEPISIAFNGQIGYIACRNDGSIRKIENGVVTTLKTGLNLPSGICYSNYYNRLFVAETGANRILRLYPTTGETDYIYGDGTAATQSGYGTNAQTNGPLSLSTDSFGATIYVIESGSDDLRYIDSDYLDTYIPDFARAPTSFSRIGSFLAATQRSENRVTIHNEGSYAVTLGTGSPGTAFGFGDQAQFSSPWGIVGAFADGSPVFFVADSSNHRIVQIRRRPGMTGNAPSHWVVEPIAGRNTAGYGLGAGNVASFNSPHGLALSGANKLLVADRSNHRIRTINLPDNRIPVGPIGNGGSVPIDRPRITNADGFLGNGLSAVPFFVNGGALTPGAGGQQSLHIQVPEGVVGFEFTVHLEGSTATLGTPDIVVNPGSSGAGSPNVMVRTVSGVSGSQGGGSSDGTLAEASYNQISGIAVDNEGNTYVSEVANHTIRRISASGNVVTIGGRAGAQGTADGIGSDARFSGPGGITVNPDGNEVFVADTLSNTIRRLSLVGDPQSNRGWQVSTIAGGGGTLFADGTGNVARFNNPRGICQTSNGNLYVAERTGNRIRRIDFVGTDRANASHYHVRTIAGDTSNAAPGNASTDGYGTAARFHDPIAIVSTNIGDIYIAEFSNHRIRKMTPAGLVTSLNAGGTGGFADGAVAGSRFNGPHYLATDESSHVYVADSVNAVIRRISPDGRVGTVAGVALGQGDTDGTGNVARFRIPRAIAVLRSGDVMVGDISRLRILQRIVNE
jgi:sugar lactone lactonase YvrE